MKSLPCPHCGNDKIRTARIPKDVVVVVPCPSCSEWVVLFRNKAVAVSRQIIQEGSFAEKKEHIAGVIAEFIHPDMFNPHFGQSPPEGFGFAPSDFEDPFEPVQEDTSQDLISQKEVDRFLRVDLQRIDEPGYFKRHFG